MLEGGGGLTRKLQIPYPPKISLGSLLAGTGPPVSSPFTSGGKVKVNGV